MIDLGFMKPGGDDPALPDLPSEDDDGECRHIYNTVNSLYEPGYNVWRVLRHCPMCDEFIEGVRL